MAVSVLAFTLSAAADASAQPYELTENEVTEVSQFNTPEVSVFGIKLGDTEDKVKDNLIKIKLPGGGEAGLYQPKHLTALTA